MSLFITRNKFDNTGLGKNFKKFVFGTSINNSEIQSVLLKYISVSAENEFISGNDGNTYYFYNLAKSGDIENSKNNKYAAVSAKIANLKLAHNESSNDAYLNIKSINNTTGFQTSVSPAIRVKESENANIAELYLKSDLGNTFIEKYSLLFNASPDNGFVYDLQRKNDALTDGSVFPLIEIQKSKQTNNTVDIFELENTTLVNNKNSIRFEASINKAENTFNDIFGIELSSTAARDENSKASVIANGNKYSLVFDDEFNEYNLTKNKSFFAFGLENSNLIISEYANNEGIVFNFINPNICMFVDEIREAVS